MNAVVNRAVDIGPNVERYFYAKWALDGCEVETPYKVSFRIDYPNIRDRGYGRNADVVILAVEMEDANGDWKPARLSRPQWDAIANSIEVDELALD